jgi:hypothetical protein
MMFILQVPENGQVLCDEDTHVKRAVYGTQCCFNLVVTAQFAVGPIGPVQPLYVITIDIFGEEMGVDLFTDDG